MALYFQYTNDILTFIVCLNGKYHVIFAEDRGNLESYLHSCGAILIENRPLTDVCAELNGQPHSNSATI
jgi:hypothetical protein